MSPNCPDFQPAKLYLLTIEKVNRIFIVRHNGSDGKYCHVFPGDAVAWEIGDSIADPQLTLTLREPARRLFDTQTTSWTVMNGRRSEVFIIDEEAEVGPNGLCGMDNDGGHEYEIKGSGGEEHPGPEIIVCPPGGCH